MVGIYCIQIVTSKYLLTCPSDDVHSIEFTRGNACDLNYLCYPSKFVCRLCWNGLTSDRRIFTFNAA